MFTDSDFDNLRMRYEADSISLFDSFYDRFKAVKLEHESVTQTLANKFLQSLKGFESLIQKHKPEIEKYFRESAPNYNVFKIVGLDRKEVITHTPFLANLLSPYESHQQANLFLRRFLVDLCGFSESDSGHPSWNVIKEREQIDLRIENKVLNKAVFIENKIDTAAHSGQLSRYFKNWKENFNGGAFIYLTINGDQPPDDGFDEKVYPKVDVIREMHLFSYKVGHPGQKYIYEWIESSLEEIESPKVQYTVKQYLELIKQL